jgi:glutamate-5-semialdehyde dehydrogenase
MEADLQQHAVALGHAARRAGRHLASTTAATRQRALHAIADAIDRCAESILAANDDDVVTAGETSVAIPLVERLKLSPKKVAKIATDVRSIADQPDPVGRLIETHTRPDGLRIDKVRVPLGVVLFIYESRPNVTADAAALCLKSGNAVILRGGKEARQSNRAIGRAIADAIRSSDLDPAIVQVVESTDRALVPLLLKRDADIDLVIPRGGENLIRTVVAESTIPVLKHYTGNCHIYVDKTIDGMEDAVRKICLNAKTSYPGGAACNVVEKILFHRDIAAHLLPQVCTDLAKANVQIRGDDRTRALYPQAIPATETDWFTEYLSLTIGIKVVDNISAAIEHINHYGSHHTDAILSRDPAAIDLFTKAVDSASVMVNASTRFADGGEYGLGAEIGISTDKLHARGPMGAADLTTYKWIVTGHGHVR